MQFIEVTQNKQSRNYCPEERDSAEFVAIMEAIGINRGAYRNWEYAAAFKAIGDPRGKRILSIGAFQCALSLYLSRFAAELVAADRICGKPLHDWAATQAYQWGAATRFLEGDFGEYKPAENEQYDIIISIGAIEHQPPGNNDSKIAANIGKLLAPEGVAAITTEWCYEHYYDPDFVGGWIYDLSALDRRLVVPSKLDRGPFTFRSVSWDECIRDFPAMEKAKTTFCPALLVLEHDKPKTDRRFRY